MSIQARRTIYLPEYTKAARKTEEYKEILGKLKKGQDVILIDVDGPDINQYPNGVRITPDYLVKALNDPKRSFGHGYACAWALLNYS